VWEKLRDNMMAQLDGISIDDLCREARDKGLGSSSSPQARQVVL
jgi:hypothetical protein